MAYDNVLNILSDASAELGLGTLSAVYAATDANTIQMRTILKSCGRKLTTMRDWTHLQKEAKIVTYDTWAASTAYVTTASAVAWATGTAYAVGDLAKNASNLYECTTAGTSSTVGAGPQGQSASISDGTVTWKYLNAGAASLVSNGAYWYTCTTAGTSAATVGPYRQSAGTEVDGGVTWTFGGNAYQFALPTDFSNMIDQTGWNRTNRIPLGGPLSPQEWQYLEGRVPGVVFTVLFRPAAGLLEFYPDTAIPALQTIAYEYQSTYWAGTSTSTSPTLTVPTADTDLVYFDQTLMTKMVKLYFARAKGLPTEHLERDFNEQLEMAMNNDGSGALLNLRGRRPFDLLIGTQNVPITGFGL